MVSKLTTKMITQKGAWKKCCSEILKPSWPISHHLFIGSNNQSSWIRLWYMSPQWISTLKTKFEPATISLLILYRVCNAVSSSTEYDIDFNTLRSSKSITQRERFYRACWQDITIKRVQMCLSIVSIINWKIPFGIEEVSRSGLNCPVTQFVKVHIFWSYQLFS